VIGVQAGHYETQTHEDSNEVFGLEFQSHLRSDAVAPTKDAGARLKGQEGLCAGKDPTARHYFTGRR
jgi:hypothetical protein